MGQFAFSESFNNLRDRKLHNAIRMVRPGMGLTGPFNPVAWLIRIGFKNRMAAVARDLHRLLKWCSQQVDERIEVNVPHKKRCGVKTISIASVGCRKPGRMLSHKLDGSDRI